MNIFNFIILRGFRRNPFYSWRLWYQICLFDWDCLLSIQVVKPTPPTPSILPPSILLLQFKTICVDHHYNCYPGEWQAHVESHSLRGLSYFLVETLSMEKHMFLRYSLGNYVQLLIWLFQEKILNKFVSCPSVQSVYFVCIGRSLYEFHRHWTNFVDSSSSFSKISKNCCTFYA